MIFINCLLLALYKNNGWLWGGKISLLKGIKRIAKEVIPKGRKIPTTCFSKYYGFFQSYVGRRGSCHDFEFTAFENLFSRRGVIGKFIFSHGEGDAGGFSWSETYIGRCHDDGNGQEKQGGLSYLRHYEECGREGEDGVKFRIHSEYE